MTLPDPNLGTPPTPTQLFEAMVALRQKVTTVEPLLNQIARDVDTLLAVMNGDPRRGIERGVLGRLSDVEKSMKAAVDQIDDLAPVIKQHTTAIEELQTKEKARTTRELIFDTQVKFVVGIAAFLGVTNLAGILAFVALLRGWIQL